METKTNHKYSSELNTDKGKTIKLFPIGYALWLKSKWIDFTGLSAAYSICSLCGQYGCLVVFDSASIFRSLFYLNITGLENIV